jgi:hypothetical protein
MILSPGLHGIALSTVEADKIGPSGVANRLNKCSSNQRFCPLGRRRFRDAWSGRRSLDSTGLSLSHGRANVGPQAPKEPRFASRRPADTGEVGLAEPRGVREPIRGWEGEDRAGMPARRPLRYGSPETSEFPPGRRLRREAGS